MTEGKKGKGNPVHRRPSASAPPPVFHPPCQVKDYESTFPSRIQSLTLWQAGSGRRVVLASAPPGILLEEVLAAEGGTQGSTRVDISSITFVASFLVPGTPPKVMKKYLCRGSHGLSVNTAGALTPRLAVLTRDPGPTWPGGQTLKSLRHQLLSH